MKKLRGAVVGLVMTVTPALAFPDKNIDFVIPAGPGGGTDVLGRLFAPYLEKHLPGDHLVVPRNVTGAGGLRGGVTVYESGSDGHTIACSTCRALLCPRSWARRPASRSGR